MQPRWNQLLSHLPKPAARWSRLFGLGTLVGVFGGLAAAGLHSGLHHGTRLLVGQLEDLGGAGIFRFHFGILLLPALGGLISGLFVQKLFREPSGHGTDLLVRAFHRNMGEMPLKGPLLKAIAVIGVLSCGGCTGPEGPIAALGAAIGSTCGRLFSLTPRERRILLVAGCGAGIGAIFQCPLGGALFAAGVLYQEPEFESDAIVTSFVASVIGYTTFISFHGTDRMLAGTADLRFESARELIPYIVLGPACGLVSIFLSICNHTIEERIVPRIPLPRWFIPAIGGLATGALACILPQVMDGQYMFVRNAMDPRWIAESQPAGTGWWWWAGLFGAVALLKCIGNACTVGSGASGGVLGPAVFIGGAIGACIGAAFEALFPDTFPEELRQALIPVGMAGVLAAGMRTPLAAMVMVTEMTGSYGLIVPLMLVCVSAYVVGRKYGLNKEQVRSAAESPAHAGDAIIHLLEATCVEKLMERSWPMIATPGTTLKELVQRIRPGTRPVFAVVENGAIRGIISVPDIYRIMEDPALAEVMIAADMMTERLTTVYEDDDLYHALSRLKDSNHDVLPVISRQEDRRWLGMLTRERVFEAVRLEIEDTHKLVLREHVGLSAFEQEGQLQQLVLGVAPADKDIIQRLMVPLDALGKSLREADFRRNFGAQVIAVEHADGAVECPPNIDNPLRSDQRLLAIVGKRAPSA